MSLRQKNFDQILQAAREEIHQLIAQVESEIESSYETAREEGRQKAQEDIEHATIDFESTKRVFVSNLIAQIKPVALSSAKELLVREVGLNPKAALNGAMKVIEIVPDAKQLVLRVNPKNYELFNESSEQLKALLMKNCDFQIRADSQVGFGGVVAQTELGSIDAQLETQLEEIAKIKILGV